MIHHGKEEEDFDLLGLEIFLFEQPIELFHSHSTCSSQTAKPRREHDSLNTLDLHPEINQSQLSTKITELTQTNCSEKLKQLKNLQRLFSQTQNKSDKSEKESH
jgi:hypothetical protein